MKDVQSITAPCEEVDNFLESLRETAEEAADAAPANVAHKQRTIGRTSCSHGNDWARTSTRHAGMPFAKAKVTVAGDIVVLGRRNSHTSGGRGMRLKPILR